MTILVPLCLLLVAGCPGESGRDAGILPDRSPPGAGFGGVAERVLPSIVFIQAEAALPRGLEAMIPGHPELPDEPLPIGMGSGVLISEDGLILTNNHVVQQAERVLVMLHDRRHFEAVVVGRDPSTEVAVVRIEGSGFPAARLGDSDAIALGDWVLAMGSPMGLQFSVTAGVVSGVGRAPGILGTPMPGMAPDPARGQAAPLEHFIQTDAALGPGNSGGPLVNSAGEVIGINTAVAAPRGVPAVYGFAIPSNLARSVADQLIEFGEVRRPYLGAFLANITPSIARAEGLERVVGAGVAQIEPGGPADRAGIRQGDIIVAIGEQAVTDVSRLQAILARLEPGASVSMQVVRQGREVTVPVELGIVRSGVGPRAAAAPR
jgi:serine protease Do